jgi:pyruvate ferredoxin oxidoreductase beta subunit
MSLPWQVYFLGISPPGANAVDFSSSAMLHPSCRDSSRARLHRAVRAQLELCQTTKRQEGNTGQQTSGATPHGARTADSRGHPGFKKDLFAIWAAHRPAYVATVIAAEPLDLAKKIERAKALKGPRLILSLAPCPPGWDFDPADTVDIGRLAVKTGVWPLKEYLDGKIVHTHVPHPRRPVEEYLKTQGRFRHLFEPRRNDALLADIQSRVDAYWAAVAA